MTQTHASLADASIAELRAIHDRLAALVAGLSPDQLTAQSGAEDWTVADVLSHLGSGSEINLHPVAAATGSDEEPPVNQDVWDRWNAMSPADQAAEFVESEERLVEAYESLSAEQRESIEIDLGFMPQPVGLATSLGMRLNEVALHGWDAETGVDPGAALSEESAELLARHHVETMPFLLGFAGRTEDATPARVALGDYSIVISAEGVRLEAGTGGATATFEGPLEAGLRLMAGRLKPERTPDGVAVTGNVSLDDLRKVFPGY